MWQLDGDKARLETPQLRCSVDLAAPSGGTRDFAVKLNEQDVLCDDCAIARLIFPGESPKISDVYVRGRDLIATYSETSQYPCLLQVYWSFECYEEVVGLQIMISTQTSRLDVPSELLLRSEFSIEPQMLRDEVVVVSKDPNGFSYVELTDGSNVESTVVRGHLVERSLFPGTLEKGVIRRARMLSCFVPTSSVEASAPAIHDRFLQSDLPLTT